MEHVAEIIQALLVGFIALLFWRGSRRPVSVGEQLPGERPAWRVRTTTPEPEFCKSITFVTRVNGDNIREKFHSSPKCSKHNTERKHEELIAERTTTGTDGKPVPPKYYINNHAIERE